MISTYIYIGRRSQLIAYSIQADFKKKLCLANVSFAHLSRTRVDLNRNALKVAPPKEFLFIQGVAVG